jgi:peptidoglycan/LPS O-acetylase OafA/YrhL
MAGSGWRWVGDRPSVARSIGLPEKTYKTLQNPWILGGMAALFIGVNSLGKSIFPGAAQEMLEAYLLLLLGISLSGYIQPKNSVLTNLGLCTFGIYLIHPLSMNGVGVVLNRIAPFLTAQVSIYSMLCFSILAFLVSWIAVAILMHNRVLAKYMSGV